MKEQINYTTILHQARKDLEITMIDYCIADSIYHLSNNPKNKGWCYASKEYLADFIGITSRGVFKSLNKLIEKNLIKREKNTGQLQTTEKWYKIVILGVKDYEQSSHCTMNKVHTDYEQSSHYNNNDINNNIKDISKDISCKTSFAEKYLKENKEIKPRKDQKLFDLIERFKDINPSYQRFFNNITQREALQRLLKQHGIEKVSKIINTLIKTNQMQFAPVITTPLQLESKLAQLIAFIQKKKLETNKNKILKI